MINPSHCFGPRLLGSSAVYGEMRNDLRFIRQITDMVTGMKYPVFPSRPVYPVGRKIM